MIIKEKQFKTFELDNLDKFVRKMNKSILDNLEVNTISFDDLKIMILDFNKKYNLKMEQSIEDYLLMHLHYKLGDETSEHYSNVQKIMQNKHKDDEMKIDELRSYLLTV